MRVLEKYTLLKNLIASECKGEPKSFSEVCFRYTQYKRTVKEVKVAVTVGSPPTSHVSVICVTGDGDSWSPLTNHVSVTGDGDSWESPNLPSVGGHVSVIGVKADSDSWGSPCSCYR